MVGSSIFVISTMDMSSSLPLDARPTRRVSPRADRCCSHPDAACCELREKISEPMEVHNWEGAERTAQEFFASCMLDEDLKHDVLHHYREMGGPLVAVRSSATREDLTDASFAGQYRTFVNVQGEPTSSRLSANVGRLLENAGPLFMEAFTPWTNFEAHGLDNPGKPLTESRIGGGRRSGLQPQFPTSDLEAKNPCDFPTNNPGPDPRGY